MQKKYIIIASILVVYVAIMVLIFGNGKDAITDNTYLVIGNNTRWHYIDGKWNDLEIQADAFNDIEFEVYKNQIYKGKFYLQNYDDTWYFFDKNNKSYDLYGQLFAYSSDEKIDVIEFKTTELDLTQVNELLKKYDLKASNFSELSVYKKISYNLDNDEDIENIYVISNVSADNARGKDFSIILYEDNSKTTEIIKKINTVDYIYEVSNIIDTNSDLKYEIIVEHKKPMNPSMNCHSMYQLKKGKYKEIKSCG